MLSFLQCRRRGSGYASTSCRPCCENTWTSRAQPSGGVVKAPKTKAGICTVDLSPEALLAQRPLSAAKGKRIWLNSSTMEP